MVINRQTHKKIDLKPIGKYVYFLRDLGYQDIKPSYLDFKNTLISLIMDLIVLKKAFNKNLTIQQASKYI